jgi:hypothetical protein
MQPVRHQATAPQDDGEDEIEDWAQCERALQKVRKLGGKKTKPVRETGQCLALAYLNIRMVIRACRHPGSHLGLALDSAQVLLVARLGIRRQQPQSKRDMQEMRSLSLTPLPGNAGGGGWRRSSSKVYSKQ